MKREKKGQTGRVGGEAALAFADGIATIGVASLVFPSRPVVWAVAAALGALPAWWRHVRASRVAELRFVPDPRRPDFKSFGKAFASSIAEVASGDADRRSWTLCPYCGGDGSFRPYSVDPVPANGSVEIGPAGKKVIVRPPAALRVDAPVPVTVTDHPVTIWLMASSRRGEVRLCAHASPVRRAAFEAIIAAPVILMASFPGCGLFSPERVAAAMVTIAVVMLGFGARRRR